jgi:hypothetical protein
MTGDLSETQEAWLERIPAARATFTAWTLEDALESGKSSFAMTRRQAREESKAQDASAIVDTTVEAGGGNSGPSSAANNIDSGDSSSKIPMQEDELDTLQLTMEYWGATNPPPNIHIGMSDDLKKEWLEAYETDP